MNEVVVLKKFVLLIVFALSFHEIASSQENYLNRVPELQENARLATGGAKGCGKGSIVLVTSTGEIGLGTGLDPIHVFGKKIVVADVLKLLEARIESNKSGQENEMSGSVDKLMYVIFSFLGRSKDPKVIFPASQLLRDKSDTIRRWAFGALINLAGADEDLKERVKKIEFPVIAIESAKARRIIIPGWVKAEK